MMMRITNGVDCVQCVQFLSLGVFCQLLVNHFTILFSQNKIEWPECKLKTRKRMAPNDF